MIAVAGVDGGGSGTRVLIVDGEGRELGSAVGPAGLVNPGGTVAAARVVERTLRDAARAAGVRQPLRALWCGLAGAGREEVRRAVALELASLGVALSLGVGTDVEAAFRDAFGADGEGVLMVAGTGSIAMARARDGTTVRVGGWGPLLGDEGSAYRIGLEGLRAVLRAYDGRSPATTLAPLLLERAGVGEAEELIAFASGATKAEIAALAPDVVGAAETDEAARAITNRAVDALSEQVTTAARRARLEPDAAEAVLVGGVVGSRGALRAELEKELTDLGFAVACRTVRPERGAAAAALELAGRGLSIRQTDVRDGGDAVTK